MPDIYLYQGEVNPADVLLSDPTVLRAGSTASISAAQTLASLTQSASVATVIAAGLRPCSGAILVLVFTLSQNMFAAGVAAVLAMSAGTALTTGALGVNLGSVL